LKIYNDTAVDMYVKEGVACTSTSKSFTLRAGQLYEMPQRYYSGIVTAALASGTGDIDVTETTA
jgi:hypothetical protein